MLACAQCGVHLPRDEALPGRGGVFCGEAHRADYEQAHRERHDWSHARRSSSVRR